MTGSVVVFVFFRGMHVLNYIRYPLYLAEYSCTFAGRKGTLYSQLCGEDPSIRHAFPLLITSRGIYKGEHQHLPVLQRSTPPL